MEVLWNQLIGGGSEHLILRPGSTIEADGLAVGRLNEDAYRIRYQIVCDANWNVQKVSVKNLLSGQTFALTKSRDGWLDEQGRPAESLRGCSDVDIMVTPFTNTLSIRRLNLAIGEVKEMAVVYVRVPELSLSRLKQRYTCLEKGKDGGLVRYENLGNGFTSDLKVDEDGLVSDYPGIFKMVWKRIG
jgi:hypothetical protein